MKIEHLDDIYSEMTWLHFFLAPFRIFAFPFVMFGMWAALPLMVWDVTSRFLFTPIAIMLTLLSVFLPIGVVVWVFTEDDPGDTEVPFRFRQEAGARAILVVSAVIGTAALFWFEYLRL